MNRPLTLAAALTAILLAPATPAQTPPQPIRSPTTLTTSPMPRPAATNYAPPAPPAATNQQSQIQNPQTPPAQPLLVTDPAYKLAIGDELSIDVYGESDMSASQRIDQQGNVRLPLINEVNIAARTVREAESYLEQLYIDKRLLKKPLVTINVRQYASRQVTIIGSVNSPGIFTLPRESDSIEIVELISAVGGFRPTAKSDAVRVTRTDAAGKETTSYIDVDAMIYNKRNSPKSFKIHPGDRILVTERLW